MEGILQYPQITAIHKSDTIAIKKSGIVENKKSDTIEIKKNLQVLTVKQQLINWIIQYNKPLYFSDSNILISFCSQDNFEILEKRNGSQCLINIISKEKENENEFIQFHAYDSMIFVHLKIDLFEYTQYCTNKYIFQFFNFANDWCCQKIYDNVHKKYVHSVWRKVSAQFCNSCGKNMNGCVFIDDETCLNCESNVSNIKYLNESNNVIIDPDTIVIEKNSSIIKSQNLSLDKSDDDLIEKKSSVIKSENLLFDVSESMCQTINDLCWDLKQYIEICKKKPSQNQNKWHAALPHFILDACKQKIKLNINSESLYHYHCLNNLSTIIYCENNIINYYRHEYIDSNHVIICKKNKKYLSYVIFDKNNTLNFTLPDFESNDTDEILKETFKCCHIHDPDIFCRYFHYIENIDDNRVLHRKILSNSKEILFNAYNITNSLDCTIASCDEPDELVIFKNNYSVKDDPDFYKKISSETNFYCKLFIFTENSTCTREYRFDYDFQISNKKIKYKNPELNNQFHIYQNNRLFILYFENKFINEYKKILPIRGILEFGQTKLDFYDYTMAVYHQNCQLFKLAYKSDPKIYFQDNEFPLNQNEIEKIRENNIFMTPNFPDFEKEFMHMSDLISEYAFDVKKGYKGDDPEFEFIENLLFEPLSINSSMNSGVQYNIIYNQYDDDKYYFMMGFGFFQKIKKIVVEKMEDLNIISSTKYEYDVIGTQTSNNNGDQNYIEIKIDKNKEKLIFSQIGYKACKTIDNKKCIVKLGIYPDSKVVYSARYNKYRTNKAFVLDILDMQGNNFYFKEQKAYSFIYVNDKSFSYVLHKDVEVLNFDINIDNDCSNGIHYHNEISDIKRWFNYALSDLYHVVDAGTITKGDDTYDVKKYVPIFKLELFDYHLDGKKYNNLYTSNKPIDQNEIKRNKMISYIREFLFHKNIYDSDTIEYIYDILQNKTIEPDDILNEIDIICKSDNKIINLLTNKNNCVINDILSDVTSKNEPIDDVIEFNDDVIEFNNDVIENDDDVIENDEFIFNNGNNNYIPANNNLFEFDEFVFNESDYIQDFDEKDDGNIEDLDQNSDNIIIIPKSSESEKITKRKCIN